MNHIKYLDVTRSDNHNIHKIILLKQGDCVKFLGGLLMPRLVFILGVFLDQAVFHINSDVIVSLSYAFYYSECRLIYIDI